jgi:hypothetical protein
MMSIAHNSVQLEEFINVCVCEDSVTVIRDDESSFYEEWVDHGSLVGRNLINNRN